ncbi:uncharacterized protein KZ484_001208 isoform 2-T2 [Pholidichthys leucotaenia]
MRLFLLSFFLQMVQAGSKEVTGYIGENVTLPSQAKPQWKLSKTEWSVFSNHTYIAVYRNKKTNADRLDRYKGRLTLNTTSGDLTIQNLSTNDAMDYRVDLTHSEGTQTNEVTLKVKEQLKMPTIGTVFNNSDQRGCYMVLNCSSEDEGVNISFLVEPTGVWASHIINPTGNSSSISAIINGTQDVTFTCISSRNSEKKTAKVTSKCNVSDTTPKPTAQPVTPCRDRCGLCFLGGMVLCIISVIIFSIIKFMRDRQLHRDQSNNYNLTTN